MTLNQKFDEAFELVMGKMTKVNNRVSRFVEVASKEELRKEHKAVRKQLRKSLKKVKKFYKLAEKVLQEREKMAKTNWIAAPDVFLWAWGCVVRDVECVANKVKRLEDRHGKRKWGKGLEYPQTPVLGRLDWEKLTDLQTQAKRLY